MRLITKIITFFCILQLSAFGALPCDGFLGCADASQKVEVSSEDVPSCHKTTETENNQSKENKNESNHLCKCCVLFSQIELKVKPDLLSIMAMQEVQFTYQQTNLINFNRNLFRPPIV